MESQVHIRPRRPSDDSSIAALTQRAFGGDVEVRLIARIHASEASVPELSLVATIGDQVVGHILLSRIVIRREHSSIPALAMAPMAVLPEWQRKGIGSKLVREALQQAERFNHRIVVVLGHPAFYPRFGFRPASTCGVRPPFDAPDEAFMIAFLGDSSTARDQIDGVVKYSDAFDCRTYPRTSNDRLHRIGAESAEEDLTTEITEFTE